MARGIFSRRGLGYRGNRVWEVSSGSESVRLLAWQAENSTSGWGSFWERSPLGSWFSTSAFRNVPGTVQENVRICGFKRNLSNFDRAPKMLESVLPNSWDSFLLTFSSISSETCAIYSSVIPGASEFCDWLFPGYSCVSLTIAANFRLFLNVAISGKKFNSGENWIICIFWNKSWAQRESWVLLKENSFQ